MGQDPGPIIRFPLGFQLRADDLSVAQQYNLSDKYDEPFRYANIFFTSETNKSSFVLVRCMETPS